MPWKLTISITGGNQRGEKYDFLKDSILIGRSKRADLMLNDASVSAEHSRILMREDVVEVEDLGSTNGTFLNSLPVQRSTIKTGDRIQIGRSELEIRLEPLTEKNRLASAIYQSALIAGYTEEERNFIADSMVENLVAAHSFAFSNGEELLVETVSWFDQMRSPDLIITGFQNAHHQRDQYRDLAPSIREGFQTRFPRARPLFLRSARFRSFQEGADFLLAGHAFPADGSHRGIRKPGLAYDQEPPPHSGRMKQT